MLSRTRAGRLWLPDESVPDLSAWRFPRVLALGPALQGFQAAVDPHTRCFCDFACGVRGSFLEPPGWRLGQTRGSLLVRLGVSSISVVYLLGDLGRATCPL